MVSKTLFNCIMYMLLYVGWVGFPDQSSGKNIPDFRSKHSGYLAQVFWIFGQNIPDIRPKHSSNRAKRQNNVNLKVICLSYNFNHFLRLLFVWNACKCYKVLSIDQIMFRKDAKRKFILLSRQT